MTERKQIIGVKVGSMYSCGAVPEVGTDVPRTTVVKSCITYVRDPINSQVTEIIIGTETPDSIFPLDKGIIESDDALEPTGEILDKLELPSDAYVVAAIPANEIMHGRHRLRQALMKALNPNKIVLVSEIYCGAVKSLGFMNSGDESVLKAFHSSFLAINLGSTTTEILVIIRAKKKYLNSFTDVNGNQVDHDLYEAIQNNLGKVIITLPEVRAIKEAYSLKHPQDIMFKVMTKNGMTEQYTGKPIVNALKTYVSRVASLTTRILTNTLERETIAQILKSPIVLTGGMGNIEGLPEALEDELRSQLHYEYLTCMKQTDGHIAPCLGALMIASKMDWTRVS